MESVSTQDPKQNLSEGTYIVFQSVDEGNYVQEEMVIPRLHAPIHPLASFLGSPLKNEAMHSQH